MGGYRPKVLVGEHEVWLLERTKQRDFTLRGLVGELFERGLKVDYKTVWTFVHAHGLSYKKKHSAKRAGTIGHRSQTGTVAEVSRQD
jgi:putative transposase